MSAYHIDLGQLEGELIAVDGFMLTPIAGRRRLLVSRFRGGYIPAATHWHLDPAERWQSG